MYSNANTNYSIIQIIHQIIQIFLLQIVLKFETPQQTNKHHLVHSIWCHICYCILYDNLEWPMISIGLRVVLCVYDFYFNINLCLSECEYNWRSFMNATPKCVRNCSAVPSCGGKQKLLVHNALHVLVRCRWSLLYQLHIYMYVTCKIPITCSSKSTPHAANIVYYIHVHFMSLINVI